MEKSESKITRRDLLKTACLAGAGALLAGGGTSKAYAAGSPPIKKWIDPLISAIPVAALAPVQPYPGADYYEIYMAGGKWQFHTQLPVTAIAPSTTLGYGSSNFFIGYLGPTIEAKQGRAVVVKFINNLPLVYPLAASIDPTVPDSTMYEAPDGTPLPGGRATPHLHGGFTPPQFDGHPDSWFTPDQVANGHNHGMNYATLPGAAQNEAIYCFPNNQPAAMLWYHDHAMGITRLNAYAGLAALYFVRDAQDTGLSGNPLGLPAGPYEIPLVIQDKQFNPDGSLFYPTVGITPTHPIWVPEFFGDTPVVNGKAYPFLKVEPRRYRFRIVNGSQARFYNLSIASGGGKNVPLWVIGMEQSLLPAAVPLQQLLIGPGERADVIVDFTGIKLGNTFMLNNNAKTPYPGGGGRPAGPSIPNIMQFRVVASPAGTPADTTTLPASLALPAITPLVPTPTAPQREIVMKEMMDMVLNVPLMVFLNERMFMDPVEETPKVDDVELWQYINLTVDAHPMHSHLVKFQVVNRQAFNVATYTTDYMTWINSTAPGEPRNQATKPVLANYLIGAPILPSPEESGWKDTAKAYPGQILRVQAKYEVPEAAPGIEGSETVLPAEYVYHCHILEHEENEMMRPFKVTVDGILPVAKQILASSEKPGQIPILEQNYPNPFNPSTEIRFQLASPRKVELKVFNMIGQEVRKLTDDLYGAGKHSVTWNGKDNRGRTVSAGVYVYRLKTGNFVTSKRMMMLK